jgi:hypothetical protein
VRRLGGSIRTCRWGRRLLALPISNMYSILCIAFSAVNSPFTVVFAHKATNVGLTGHARRHSWPCAEKRGVCPPPISAKGVFLDGWPREPVRV